eukprot:5191432-Heterocapsa_arctica.AAC.1
MLAAVKNSSEDQKSRIVELASWELRDNLPSMLAMVEKAEGEKTLQIVKRASDKVRGDKHLMTAAVEKTPYSDRAEIVVEALHMKIMRFEDIPKIVEGDNMLFMTFMLAMVEKAEPEKTLQI